MWQLSRRQFASTLSTGILGAISSILLLNKSKSFVGEARSEDSNIFRHPLTNHPILGYSGELVVLRPGAFAEVQIDPANGIFTKRFRVDGTNTMGEKIAMLEPSLEKRYQTEKRAYQRLAAIGSKYLPELLVFNDQERSISMKYYGPDMLTQVHLLGKEIPASYRSQIVTIFEEYRRAGIFKVNFNLSNLVIDEANGRLLPVDFTEQVERNSLNLIWELHHLSAIVNYFSDLENKLFEVYADFSPELVAQLANAAGLLEAKFRNEIENGGAASEEIGA